MLLKFAIQDFYDDREYKNLSSRTITSYKEILEQFYEYCLDHKVLDVNDITTSTVKNYILWCRKRGNKPTTTNSKLSRIKAFLNYLVDEEVIKESPANKLSLVKEDIQIQVFTDYHIRQMLNYYRRLKQRDKSFYAYRNHTIIITLLSTGIRQTELCNAKWDDVDFSNYSFQIFGKNRRTETIPLTRKLVKELSAYKVFCEQQFGKGNLNKFIFTNRHNGRLTPNAVQNIFKRLSKIMNFKDVRLSSHTFRHTFCQRCIQSGMSTFAVQKLMRHSSIAVTERYAAMWGNDLREQNDKYNPLNDLDI